MFKIAITTANYLHEGTFSGMWINLSDYQCAHDLLSDGIARDIGIDYLGFDNGKPDYEKWYLIDIDCDLPAMKFEKFPSYELLDDWIIFANKWNNLYEEGKKLIAQVCDVNNFSVPELIKLVDTVSDNKFTVHEDTNIISIAMKRFNKNCFVKSPPYEQWNPIIRDCLDLKALASLFNGNNMFEFGDNNVFEILE